MNRKTAVIIGAGPAGLTAAYELLENTDIKPIIFEQTSHIGGISRTENYKGNRIDIGGHRFFSKSDRIMQWWQNILPLQGSYSKDDLMLGRNFQLSSKLNAPDPEKTDKAMLIRSRLSRIFYLRKFYDYPISFNFSTLSNLGISRIIKITASYIKACCFPIKNELSLEDFLVNRFGRELYLTFFKDYTEKVWGVPPLKIKPEWGRQRIRGLSITKSLFHALKSIIKSDNSVEQKDVETSLISRFLYPKYGPGQMWEEVAKIIISKGGEINLGCRVTGIKSSNDRIANVNVLNMSNNEHKTINGDYFISSMPVKDLILSIKDAPSDEILNVANGLAYRDFITVGLLLKELKVKNQTKINALNGLIPDNWIYIQESDVKVGRLQIFNNWSPYMVNDINNVWVGLEYFCSEGDELWSKNDKDLIMLAKDELCKIDIINKDDFLDGVVIRSPKTYPAYFGTYDNFDLIQNYVDRIENLFLIGRNGMHRYNNMDHSMLTAMEAVNNIKNGLKEKGNIWAINVEEEYHESK
jgi:protoporphyrinogen oxidase